MPTLAAEKDGVLFIGLSGNPFSAAIPFEMFVREILSLKMGDPELKLRRETLTAVTGFSKNSRRRRFLRGKAIEEKLAKIQYAAYEHVGKLADGFFPVFDFFKNGEGISVKTIDVRLKSYEKDSAILRKVKEYASDLSDDVIQRKLLNFKKGEGLSEKLNAVREVSTKRLDIYVPKGTLSRTKDIPSQMGDVLIRIFEY